MNPFDPDPARAWLFCLTHPDDELAIGAWIRRLVLGGSEVWLSWTHRTDVREREARAAARMFGVPDDRLVFHAGEDGRICEQLSELAPSFEAMIMRFRPDVVCCCAFEQGHLDHDATNLLVHRAFDGPVFEFPTYHTYLVPHQTIGRFADPIGEEILLLEPEEKSWKALLLEQYPSQKIKRIVIWYQRLAWLFGRDGDLGSTERLRRQTHTDFLTPNLPEPLRSRVARSRPWARWVKSVRALESVRRA